MGFALLISWDPPNNTRSARCSHFVDKEPEAAMVGALPLQWRSRECNQASHFQSLCCKPWPASSLIRSWTILMGFCGRVWETLSYSGLFTTGRSGHMTASGTQPGDPRNSSAGVPHQRVPRNRAEMWPGWPASEDPWVVSGAARGENSASGPTFLRPGSPVLQALVVGNCCFLSPLWLLAPPLSAPLRSYKFPV